MTKITTEEVVRVLDSLLTDIDPEEWCEYGSECGECDKCQLLLEAHVLLSKAEDELGL